MGSRLSNTNTFVPYFSSAEASYATLTTHTTGTPGTQQMGSTQHSHSQQQFSNPNTYSQQYHHAQQNPYGIVDPSLPTMRLDTGGKEIDSSFNAFDCQSFG